MKTSDERLQQHGQLTRRHFMQLGTAAVAAWSVSPQAATEAGPDPQLREAIAKLEYLTSLDRKFTALDKGKAGVARLPDERLREIGLAPETWTLEVVSDPASNSVVGKPLARATGNALDWKGLMAVAETQAVRFLHVCTCTNGADPFHMSLWEGVPLRAVISMIRPASNIRRVYYQSQAGEGRAPFQSSLALAQVLEEPPGQMPVILAYKRNGQAIPAAQGGPVRVIVPGAYGSKSIKWVRRVVVTNDHKSNDSDAELNNDPENLLKTRARFIHAPREAAAGKPIPLTGMAQVGVSGLRKVQYCVHPHGQQGSAEDPYWSKADWRDAAILPPPENWGGGLPGGKLPATLQTDAAGKPMEWPLRYTIVHWAALGTGLPPGSYDLSCRTLDGNGIAQPLPRTLPRTGFNDLHVVALTVNT